MNIFGTLSQSSGFIDKHNAAAFLAFLLNPNEEHGLSSVFLDGFVRRIQEITDAAGGGALSDNEVETLLNERVNVVYGCFVEQREIDIILKSSSLTLAFNVETPTPTNPEKGELQKHYKLLKNDPCMAEQRLIMIYLAPNKEFFDDVFRGFVREIRDDDLAVRVSWEDVASILDKVLEEEQHGEIPPISDYAPHNQGIPLLDKE